MILTIGMSAFDGNTPAHGVPVLVHRLDTLDCRVDGHDVAITDIIGRSGSNGRLGKTNERIDALKERLDKTESRRWWVITFLVGTLLTVITTAALTGRWMGRIETDVDTLKVRVNRSRTFASPPDAPAAKDNSP